MSASITRRTGIWWGAERSGHCEDHRMTDDILDFTICDDPKSVTLLIRDGEGAVIDGLERTPARQCPAVPAQTVPNRAMDGRRCVPEVSGFARPRNSTRPGARRCTPKLNEIFSDRFASDANRRSLVLSRFRRRHSGNGFRPIGNVFSILRERPIDPSGTIRRHIGNGGHPATRGVQGLNRSPPGA